MQETQHVPILLDPIVKALTEPLHELSPEQSKIPHWIVDCTLGGGGHTNGLLQELAHHPHLHHHKVLAIDQDADAIHRATIRFEKEISEGRLVLQQSRFSQVDQHVKGLPVIGMLADLGFSSDQINSAQRGLSFMSDGPLDMRLDPSQGVSCRQYLQTVTEGELADVIFALGEERYSRRIASAIVQSRRERSTPKTTRELADVIYQAVPPNARHGKIHPATRTFQALRIVINQEMEELDSFLNHGIMNLMIGGRVAVISFHSLEDRKVKQAFRGKESCFESLWKKPLVPSDDEIRSNPRSRSAKLRIARKVR